MIDALVSLAIVAVVLISTWGLLKDSVNLALDAVPNGVEVDQVREAFVALPGVSAVHDLHVWGLSTSDTALTAHLVHDRPDADALLIGAQAVARSRFNISHTTFQLESGALPDCPTC